MKPEQLSLTTPAPVFAAGARVEVRGEEWMVRKAEPTSTGHTAVHVTGLSELVRSKDAIFLTDLDTEMRVLEPERTDLVDKIVDSRKKVELIRDLSVYPEVVPRVRAPYPI